MYEILNNCDELLAHMCAEKDTYRYCCGGHLEFQGDVCPIGGVLANHDNLIWSNKFPYHVFSVVKLGNWGEQIMLSIFDAEYTDVEETLGVELPNYIYDELIATIKGEW